MAYATKYSIPFKTLELRISQKDYAGSITTLQAANPAVNQSWDKDDPVAPIKACNLSANILGVPLTDFYANNDDEFKGDLFYGSQLLFSGFLVQDDCQEDVDDLIHPVSLSFTDGLGLLKDFTFDAALALIAVTTDKITLFKAIKACITATGILLPVDICADLKEDSQDTNTPFFEQTLVDKSTFLKSGRIYDNCYSVLEQIMTTFQCSITQAGGKWVIKRTFELAPKVFHYSATFTLTGTGFFSNTQLFGRNKTLYPAYGYNKRIVRPFKIVKETFDFNFTSILKNADLKDLGPFIGSQTIGDTTRKSYGLSGFVYHNYDPTIPDVTPYILVEEEATLQLEKQRYIVFPDAGNTNDVVFESAPIEVNAKDRFDTGFTYRSETNYSGLEHIRFFVKLVSGATTYYLTRPTTDLGGVLVWTTTGRGSVFPPSSERGNAYDKTDWANISLSSVGVEPTIQIPADGILTIGYALSNAVAGNDYYAKEFNFRYYTYINDSTKITGQTHTNTQNISTKNNNETDITIDDSPKNNIKGTLFLSGFTGDLQTRTTSWNQTTPPAASCKLHTFQVFGPTDPFTIRGKYCDGTDIVIDGIGSDGNPAPICARPGTVVTTGCQITSNNTNCGTYTPDIILHRLGEIITKEVKQWRSEPRTVFEGDLYGNLLGGGLDEILTPVTYFGNPDFPLLTLLPGKMELDYSNNRCTGTLHEMHRTGEVEVTSEYKFDYLYDTK
jgi:hypothetical protein